MSPVSAAQFMRIVAGVSIIIGIVFAIGGTADPAGANDLFLKLVSSGGDGINGLNTAEAKLALSIAGGVFAGFASLFLFIVAPAIEVYDRRIIRGAQISLLLWFFIDSTASITSGNPVNAVANVGFLVLFMLPMVLVKPAST